MRPFFHLYVLGAFWQKKKKSTSSSLYSVFCIYLTLGCFLSSGELCAGAVLTVHVLTVAASFHVFYLFTSSFCLLFLPSFFFRTALVKNKKKLADVDAGNNLSLPHSQLHPVIEQVLLCFQVQVHQQGALQSCISSTNHRKKKRPS